MRKLAPARLSEATVTARPSKRLGIDRARRMFSTAMDANVHTIARLAKRHAAAGPVCDIGCWDGTTLSRYAPPERALTGLERDPDAVSRARSRGIDVTRCDIREVWPVADRSVGVVTSNQVIEHVVDVDHFVSETFRILKPGGRAVVSTENLASWHNIAALALGWQPFSLTNISDEIPGIGNPCANMRGEEPFGEGWHHVHVMAVRALRELFAGHGFDNVRVHGAGYYPLPAVVGRFDPHHAAFVIVEARRRSS